MDKKFINACDYLIEKDVERNKMMEGMDEMVHCNYTVPADLPEEYAKNLFKTISTDPRDSIASAQRHLSSSHPQFKIAHLVPDAENRKTADQYELAVAKLYNQAARRKPGGLTESICWEASKYAMVAGQVMYLPSEIKARKMFDGDTRGLEFAQHFGPFAVEVHNAKDVHVQFSSWGPEMVLLHKLIRTREVLQTFGKYASKVNAAFKKQKTEWCTVFDLQEIGKRWVGVVLHHDESQEQSPERAIAIMNGMDTKLDFLPWFVQISGTTSEVAPEHQIIPMLKPIYDSGAWKTLNALNTLTMTKVIGLHYAPTLGVEGGAEVPEFGGTLETPIIQIPWGSKMIPIDVRALDTGMLTLADQMRASIDKSTVPRQIQTGEFPSGTPMGAVSIITETGMQTINPFRNAAARAMADIAWLFFAFIKANNEPLQVDAVGDGNHVIIDPEFYDLKDFDIEVVLQPKQPIDMVAKINAAQMLIDIGFPQARAMEMAYITDPQKAREEAKVEAIEDSIFAGLLDITKSELAMVAQRNMMTPELEAQAIEAEREMQGATGQGFDASAGGQSPVAAGAPVREDVTGMTQEGIPL
jgi:hypothetical protein